MLQFGHNDLSSLHTMLKRWLEKADVQGNVVLSATKEK